MKKPQVPQTSALLVVWEHVSSPALESSSAIGVGRETTSDLRLEEATSSAWPGQAQGREGRPGPPAVRFS